MTRIGARKLFKLRLKLKRPLFYRIYCGWFSLLARGRLHGRSGFRGSLNSSGMTRISSRNRNFRLRTLANCVAVFFILHFLWSYYWNCYRKGYRIDVWHFNLFQALLITSLMLPFCRSRLNIGAFGPVLLKHALPYVDEAYLISALGYGSLILGGSLWRLRLGVGLRRMYAKLLDQPVRFSMMLVSAPRLIMLHAVIALVIICTVLAIYFHIAGYGMYLNSLLLVRPELRPLAQLGAFIALGAGGAAMTRFVLRKERSMLAVTMLLAFAMLFYGTRGFLLAVFQIPALIWMMRLRTRLKLPYLVLAIAASLFLAVFLDALRRPGFSISRVLLRAGASIAFGNSFSDTRDFALVLSYWNHSFFLGKTYLAGLIAFVPRFISPFRDKWALGVVTASMVGFKPTEHAGLRIGSSGEAFLNFGLPAVILGGLLMGSINRLIDMRIKEALNDNPRDVRVYAYFVLGAFVGTIANSIGFSALYTTFLMLTLSAFLILISRFIKLPLA